MGKQIKIKATLSENVNKVFRLQTKLIHIIVKNNDVKKFPVIINNFNRLNYLQQQIDWFLKTGHKNLHIIDNASTYQPLLKYYKKVPGIVYLLNKNMGHESLWRTHLHHRFSKYFHVYTDPDVLPNENTPSDFMQYFKSLLDKYPTIQKVGFGLNSNDLPEHYPNKNEVIKWESLLYNDEVEPGIFKSKIDTTFALYRPGASFQCWGNTLRTGNPYMLRHMPWYENPGSPDEETKYYMQKINAASSWYKTLTGEDKRYIE